MSQSTYDVIIVGAGLFGSAAARHASSLGKQQRVLLIGPEEPEDRASTDIFSAHYDSGRVTFVLTSDPRWARLSSTSADYRALERESGVQFFKERLFIQVLRDEDGIERMRRTAKEFGIVMEVLRTTEARRIFPQINFRPGDVAVFGRTDNGLINPRKLIKAQKILAQRNGCNVINDVVDCIIPAPPDGDLQQVTTGQGRLYHGRRVLLATGAFTECRNLLPPELYPEVFNSKQTCVLIEISESDFANTLHSLPSFEMERHYDGNEYDFYFLPPVRYPDGKLYCKIGHGEDAPVEASTPQEIRDWYRCRGSPDMARHLIRAFHDILPGVSAVNYVMNSCVTTNIPNNQPYIDMVRPGVGVVIGGCGRGAGASDKIGYIAARMILKGSWDHDLPKEEFQYKVKSRRRPTVSKL